jgi:hypothetical protein
VSRRIGTVLALSALAFSQPFFAQDALRVSSDQTVGGFVFPESCG